jgi:hypothetical protein
MSLFQLWSFQLELLLSFFCLNNSVEDGGFKKRRPDQRFALDLINNSVLFLRPTTFTPINNKIFPPTQYNTNTVPINWEKRMMNLWRLVTTCAEARRGLCRDRELMSWRCNLYFWTREHTFLIENHRKSISRISNLSSSISPLRFHISRRNLGTERENDQYFFRLNSTFNSVGVFIFS